MEDEEYYWSWYDTTKGLPLPPGVVEGGNYGTSTSYVCRGLVNRKVVSGAYYVSYGTCWVVYSVINKPSQFELLLVPAGELSQSCARMNQ